ncbi:MAG: hypothetical protein GY694_09860 [Gammaproteobacteria bacterium]|nr:hypothetical protein [Gammaproteobacteria bacterium]
MIGATMLIAGIAFHGVLQGAYDPIMRDWINNYCNTEDRATTLSLAPMLGNLGFAALGPFFGGALDDLGIFPTTLLSLSLFLFCMFMLIVWSKVNVRI